MAAGKLVYVKRLFEFYRSRLRADDQEFGVVRYVPRYLVQKYETFSDAACRIFLLSLRLNLLEISVVKLVRKI